MGNDCSTVEVNSNVTIPVKAIFEKKYPIWELLYTNLFSSTAWAYTITAVIKYTNEEKIL